jgi:imidazolonepropionase-like amidohydrolase
MNASRSLRATFLLLSLLAARGAAAQAESPPPVLFRDIRVLTVTGPVLEHADVLFRDGLIARIAPAGTLDTTGVEVFDGPGHTLLPGLIDSRTQVGLAEVWMVRSTVDVSEATSPSTPQLMVADAINPASQVIPVTRAGGVTTVLVAPGESNVLNGQSALVHLTGGSLAEMLLRSPVGLHATLGEAPKATYGPRKTMPMSRMGEAAVLREKLVAAQEYRAKWARYRKRHREWERDREGEEPEPPGRDLEMEALVKVLEGDLPLILSAHRASDIEVGLRIAEEFGLRLILDHATEGWKLADRIAERGVPVLVGPISVQPSSMQTLGARYDNAAILHEAGVLLAIQSGSTHNARNLPFEAGLAVAHGLPWQAALEAVTINPARIFGVEDRLGSIEEGKEATAIVIRGEDPFQPLDPVVRVYIRGRAYPPVSYQNLEGRKR